MSIIKNAISPVNQFIAAIAHHYMLWKCLSWCILIILPFLYNCNENDINWDKVDPKLRTEIEHGTGSGNILFEAVIHTKEQLTPSQLNAFNERGIIIGSALGTVTTIRFQPQHLPYLTSQPSIIFISGQSQHEPLRR